MMTSIRLLSFCAYLSLLWGRKYDIPPMDSPLFSPNLYNEEHDLSRTITEASLNDDLIEWHKYDIEFLSSPRSVIFNPYSQLI